MVDDLAERLRASLAEQRRDLHASLVLNPVENFPFEEDLIAGTFLHGLYNSDKSRSREERLKTPIQFSGRSSLERDSRDVYSAWAEALGAADATLRLLSGLHAHTTLFMSLARHGQKILLLPIEAGGHLSGRAIVERLGLEVTEMVVDDDGMRVDIDATLDLCAENPPDFIFVDRSEGLVFEDFSALATVDGAVTIFDASQYLTNVVCGDHPNPFDWGFDLMIASVHKNFPGPQKALLATREENDTWRGVLKGVSAYVSNMHSASTYAAGLTLARREWLAGYSRQMLENATLLEDGLRASGVPVVRRRADLPPTHHVWIREGSRDRAFTTYEYLERSSILTNFRLLPYSLGFGVRIGVAAATRLGLSPTDIYELSELIAAIRRDGATTRLRTAARSFSEALWARQPELP